MPSSTPRAPDNPFVVHAILPRCAAPGKVFIQTSGSSVVSTYDEGEPRDAVFTRTPPSRRCRKRRRASPSTGRSSRRRPRRRPLGRASPEPDLRGGHRRGVEPQRADPQAHSAGDSRHASARHVGRGLNIWSNVHLADVVDLYVLPLEKAPAGSFLYAENGEASMKTAASSQSAACAAVVDTPRTGRSTKRSMRWVRARTSPGGRTAASARRRHGHARVDAEGTDPFRRDRARHVPATVRPEVVV